MNTDHFPWQSLDLHEFKTSDNTTLFYHHHPAKTEVPIGTLIITLAWNMSPDVYSPLLLTNPLLTSQYNIYIFIVRGYQRDTTFGNNMDRCAIDLHELITHFKINQFIAMGHSIGVALWWQYMMTYGQHAITKFILIDEMTVLLQNPATEALWQDLGSIVPLGGLFDGYNIMIKGDAAAKEYRQASILPQFSEHFQKTYPHILEKIWEKVNHYSLVSTAQILISNQTNNWIDKLLNNKIGIPTYLFCGENSAVPYPSVLYQRQFYTHHKLHMWKGPTSSHFGWMENYAEFNSLINEFIL